MSARYIVADVMDGLRSLPDRSVDLVMSSPPFLALRSYLPSDHPEKAREIGSEATPGEFLDVLLDVVVECRRVLAPHGSLVFELGDTYAGSGGVSGDYQPGGLREGQAQFDGSGSKWDRSSGRRAPGGQPYTDMFKGGGPGGKGWPLEKSKVLIPQLFAIALAYGFNPLTGRQTEPWRVRNTVAWCRPNPPVGRDGDKFRPATSFLTVACKARDRYWDGDAVRTPHKRPEQDGWQRKDGAHFKAAQERDDIGPRFEVNTSNPAGAPLLDWWEIPTSPYSGAVQGDTLYRASRDCPEHSLPAIRQRWQTASGGELRESLLRNSRRTDLGPALKQLCVQWSKTDLDTRDCSSTPDWLVQAIRSEQTTGSTAANRTPARPNGGSPSIDARTLARTLRTPALHASTDQTSGQLALEHAPIATPHSTASSRTAPAPLTSPVGTPCVGSPSGIGGTSALPESSAPRPDTSESRTDEAGPGDPSLETEPSTIGTSSRRCSCQQYTESTSHYATFPPNLVVPIVKAMCPARVCRVCGEPSRRVTEMTYGPGDPSERGWGKFSGDAARGAAEGTNAMHNFSHGRAVKNVETVGWSDCGHGGDWRAGVVLDPFAGSGTTLAVATGHGLDAIGIDLDARNAELAYERIGGLWLAIERLAAETVT